MEPRIEWSPDVDAGAWIAPGLHPFPGDVGSLVPDGFPGYVRVLHPAWRVDGGREKVRWRELARQAGAELTATTQYEDLRAGHDMEPPLLGSLERDELTVLVEILSRLSGHDAPCWFALWDGFGWLQGDGGHAELDVHGGRSVPAAAPDVPRLQLPDRAYLMYRGPVAASAASYAPPADRSPTLWWADDRSWCVASEIDLRSTYIGGSRALVQDVVGDPRLEALPVDVTDGVTQARSARSG